MSPAQTFLHASHEVGTRLDSWWQHASESIAMRRLWHWGAPAMVLFIAIFARFYALAYPHSLVFDETFYVKDAWSLWNNGYESSWPDGTDANWANGITNGFTTTGSFVVHPQLGKWLIALGMALFGADNSIGWRFSTAVAGVLLVAVIMFIAKKLFRSTLLVVVAGGLLAIDGQAIVLSRVGLLDTLLALFTLIGFALIVLDRQQSLPRLQAWVLANAHNDRKMAWGPALWNRWYLLLAGLAFGLACAVKWSGLYFLIGFALYTVLMDMLDRRKVGIHFWFSSGAFRTAPLTFVLMVPIAAVTYLVSWTGWIVTSGGYARNDITEGSPEAFTGIFSWVPLWFQNLVNYHQQAYNFHVGLTTPHSYQANPLTWLFMIRPTSMFYEGSTNGQNGCTIDSCSSAITALANPLIWWAGTAAVFYLLYRLIRYRQRLEGLILMGMLVGYVPWLAYLNRTVFQFYGIVYEPYMILAITCAAMVLIGSPHDERSRRTRGLVWLGTFGAIAIGLSIFFYPIWTGIPISYDYWHLHMWMPSWI